MPAIDFPPHGEGEHEHVPETTELSAQPLPDQSSYTDDEIDISFLRADMDTDGLLPLLETHQISFGQYCELVKKFAGEQTIKQQQETAKEAHTMVNTMTDEIREAVELIFDKDSEQSISEISTLLFNDFCIAQAAGHETCSVLPRKPGITIEMLNMHLRESVKVLTANSTELLDQRFREDVCTAYKGNMHILIQEVFNNTLATDENGDAKQEEPTPRLKKLATELAKAAASAATIAAGVAVGSIVANKFTRK